MAENLGASFSIDVTALKAGLAQANRLIRESESYFKAAGAGMDDWRKSQQGLEAKIKSLNTVTDLQQKKVDALTAEYDSLIAGGLDPTSAKAVELRTKINKETEALEKSKAETKKLESALDELTSGANDAENAVDDLGDSAEESGKDAEKASEGFTVMKGAISSLVADGIKSAVSAFGELIVAQDKASSAFQAQTGASAAEMEKWNEQMQDLYANNYGEDLQDIADSMAQVARSTQETDPDKIKDLTRNAIALRDTFGYEVNESIRAAKALMTNFGVSGDEAFTLIAQGAQDGLDYSDELIDSINEYSVQFKKVGLDADDMFNIFAEGAKSGAWNLDKVGDAVKEFSIRSIDGSKTTREAYKALGYDADEMMQTFVKGGDGARDAFRKLINKLIDVDDQVERDAIGVGLFGTMWEDLGVDAVKSLATTNKSITKTRDTMKTLDKVKYDNVGDQIAGLGREFKTEITEQLNKKATPAISNFIKKIKDSGAVEKFGKIVGFVSDNIGILITTVAGAIIAFKSFSIIGAITTGIKGLSGAFSALSATMAANPIGAVVTGIGLLITGVQTLSMVLAKADEGTELLTESQRESIDIANKNAEAYADIKKAADELAGSQIANVDYVKNNLLPQLGNIVDANGKVKKGYEDRAEFILNQLNKALGTEYDQLSDIVDANGKIKQSIYDVIEAKKAQILLASYEESYKKAIENVAAAEKARATQAQELAARQAEYDEAYKAAQEARMALDEKVADAKNESDYRKLTGEAEYVKGLELEAEKQKKLLDDVQSQYDQSESQLYQYYSDINSYEQASTLVTQGETSKAINYLNNLSSSFQTVSSTAKLSADKQKEVLEQQVIDTEVNAELMKSAYEQGVEGVSEEMVKTARKQAEKAKGEFYKVGGNITKGIAEGAEGEEKTKWTLSGAMSRLVNSAVSAAKKAAGINSPSRLFRDKVGTFIGQGVAVGISRSTKSVVNAVKDQVQNIEDAYNIDSLNIKMRAVESSFINARQVSAGAVKSANDKVATAGNSSVVVNQYNTYSQAHSRYELYKTKQQTAAAVRLAVGKA